MKKQKNSSFLSENQALIGGALLGALVGIGGAFLIDSKLGEKVKRGINDFYEDACDKVEDFAEQMAEKSGGIAEEVKCRLFNKQRSSKVPLVIGSIAGAILGVTAIAWLTSENSKEFRNNVSHTFESLTDKTREFAENMQDSTEDVVERFGQRCTPWIKIAQKLMGNTNSKKRKNIDVTLDNAVDWITTGIQLFNSIKK